MAIITILDDESSFAMIRYFESSRCWNEDAIQKFNKGRISAKELVTFDSTLMEMNEILKDKIRAPQNDQQVLAVIFRPEIAKNFYLETDNRFEFCGYDLVGLGYYISSITNCGVGFEKAIHYGNLNEYGLISSYNEAVFTQLKLCEEYPDESHAYCEVVEIWRYKN